MESTTPAETEREGDTEGGSRRGVRRALASVAERLRRLPLVGDAAVYLPAAALTAWVPRLAGGHLNNLAYFPYRVMWLNLLGHRYRMPIDTPKPLYVALAGLFPGRPSFFVAAGLFALTAVYAVRLSRLLFDARWPGLLTFVLLLFGNSYVLPGPLLVGYWPVIYYPLVLGVAYHYLRRHYRAAFGLLAVAGLLRPEAWGYAVLLLALLPLRGDRFRAGYLVALAPAVIWPVFDWFLAGSPTYSYRTLARYRSYMGLTPVSFGGYWPKLVGDASEQFSLVLLGGGALGGTVSLLGARSREGLFRHGIPLLLAGVLLAGYWALTPVTDFVVHLRFLTPAYVVLYLYAAGLPRALRAALRGRVGRLRGRARQAAGAAAVAWAAVAIWAGLATEPVPEARSVAQDRRQVQAAREEAVALIRDRWRDEDPGQLLTGRSVDYFALALGEEASRRMFQFRVVAGSERRFEQLEGGLCVYILGDTAGLGLRFTLPLGTEPAAIQGLRFEPLRPLAVGEGMAYRFRRAGPGEEDGA